MSPGVVFELGELDYEITHDPPSDLTTKAILPVVEGTRVPIGRLSLDGSGAWIRQLTPGASEDAFRALADVADGRARVGMAGSTEASAGSARAPGAPSRCACGPCPGRARRAARRGTGTSSR